MRSGSPVEVEVLDFELPPFVRWTWVSEKVRDTWASRMTGIQTACGEMEWRSVLERLRRCSIVNLRRDEVVAGQPDWESSGLVALPVFTDREARDAAPQPYIIGWPTEAAECLEAAGRGDSVMMRALLGWPACCARAAEAVSRRWRLADLTWPMAERSAAVPAEALSVVVQGSSETNTLWRALGIRPVPHFACRGDCDESIALSHALADIARARGHGPSLDLMMELLSWPVEWSALHGIAEVKTPILRFATNTDATARKLVVRFQGSRYPHEGVRGLHFPYNAAPRRIRLAPIAPHRSS